MYDFCSSSALCKNPLSVRVEKGIIAIFLLMGILTMVLLGFYISYHNKNATMAYKLRILQEQRSELLTKNESLSMKIASLSTIGRIQESLNKSDMVAITNPLYIKGNTTVAKN